MGQIMNQVLNNMLSDMAYPFIHIAGTTHGMIEHLGRSVGFL